MTQAALDHGSSEVGPILRRWRAARGQSQLDLAMTSGMSQRHVSFIENGRSRPSRAKLHDIADALDIPLRERNTLLLAAGYAPTYPEGAWDEPGMGSINAAIDRMLRQQEPYPALLLDRYWNVVRTNSVAPSLFGRFIDLNVYPQPRNLLHLLFDPAGLRPHVADWERLAASMIGRLHRESVGRLLDDRSQQLMRDLLAYPDVDTGWQCAGPASSLPMVPITLVHQGERISYFSMISTVGTPQTVLAQELRLESMFPADDASEERHLQLVSTRPYNSSPAAPI